MTDQLEVISKYSLVEIIGLIVAIVIVVSIVTQFLKKVYGDLEEWRKKKNTVEDEKEEIEKRIKELETNDIRLDAKIDNIAAGVQQIAAGLETFSESVNQRLDTITEESRERGVANARVSLYQLYEQLKDQDHISTATYESFSQLALIYTKNGGNSVVKNKIIPFVESLPVRD